MDKIREDFEKEFERFFDLRKDDNGAWLRPEASHMFVGYRAATESMQPQWIPVEQELPKDCEPVMAQVPMRYKYYKPDSQQYKKGIKGRWQMWNGYGWDNALIEVEKYLPTPPEVESNER